MEMPFKVLASNHYQGVRRECPDFLIAETNLVCSFSCKELLDCDQNLKVTNEKINHITTIWLQFPLNSM